MSKPCIEPVRHFWETIWHFPAARILARASLNLAPGVLYFLASVCAILLPARLTLTPPVLCGLLSFLNLVHIACRLAGFFSSFMGTLGEAYVQAPASPVHCPTVCA